MSIACIDVGYTEAPSQPTTAIAACVVINHWSDAMAASEHIVRISSVLEYHPGQFYLRELPCIEAVLAKLPQAPTIIVIDGYVWLDEHSKPGLAIVRKRRGVISEVRPFDEDDSVLRLVRLEYKDSESPEISPSARLAKFDGGETDCSIPVCEANRKYNERRFSDVVLVSDNESWVNRGVLYGFGAGGSTGVMTEWLQFVKNQNQTSCSRSQAGMHRHPTIRDESGVTERLKPGTGAKRHPEHRRLQ